MRMFSIFTQLRVIIWWFAVTRWKRSKLHSIQDSKSEEKKFKIKKRWASASRTAEIKWRLKEKYELACIELCPTDTQQHNYNKQFQISTCEHTLRHFTFWIEKTAEFFFPSLLWLSVEWWSLSATKKNIQRNAKYRHNVRILFERLWARRQVNRNYLDRRDDNSVHLVCVSF